MVLPKFILLKSNDSNKFLGYRKERDSYHAFLRFPHDEADKNVEIQYLKFEVQKAKSVEGLVHIRSCYNNKYWMRKSADTNWIVAEANEPEEDQSKWSCTLFKPVLVDVDDDAPVPQDEPLKIRLLHIDQLGQHYACVSENQDDHAYDLVVGIQDSNSTTQSVVGDVFTAYDARSTLILPATFALMGYTDEYCAFSRIFHLEFNTTDVGLMGVPNNTIVNNFPLSEMLIQNTSVKRYWTNFEGFVGAIAPNDSDRNILIITAIGLSSNSIALRARNGNFLSCESTRQGLSLAATATGITERAVFRVVEPVIVKEVTDVVYSINDSRVYNVSSVEKFRATRVNFTGLEQTGAFRVSYRTNQTMSWNNSDIVTSSVVATWSSGIPFVGNLGVEVSHERTESRNWGSQKVEEQTIEYEQSVIIPPSKMVSLILTATRASYDVPFTCNVHETWTDGSELTKARTDGLFTGFNEYNFVMRIVESDYSSPIPIR